MKGLSPFVLALALFAPACGGEAGEIEIDVVPPFMPEVGVELGVPLHAYAGGQPIEWTWRSLSNDRLAKRKRRPTLTVYSGGTAVWRWTPIAEDLGPQEIEFSASAGAASRAEVLTFTIGEGVTPPVFREPIGEGTTLDLRSATCARVRVTVETSIDIQAELGLAEPPENAELMQKSELSGELSFCPSARQIMDETVYPLTLTAESGGQRISRVYVIVLRRAS